MATKTREKMRAREACVVTVGARPIVYEKRIVRDRHTGRLAEIDVHELPPVDPGNRVFPTSSRRMRKSGAIIPRCWTPPAALSRPTSPVPTDSRGGKARGYQAPEYQAEFAHSKPGCQGAAAHHDSPDARKEDRQVGGGSLQVVTSTARTVPGRPQELF
jgi:hypothetical protein